MQYIVVTYACLLLQLFALEVNTMLILLKQPLDCFRKKNIFQKVFSTCNDFYERNIFKEMKEGSI